MHACPSDPAALDCFLAKLSVPALEAAAGKLPTLPTPGADVADGMPGSCRISLHSQGTKRFVADVDALQRPSTASLEALKRGAGELARTASATALLRVQPPANSDEGYRRSLISHILAHRTGRQVEEALAVVQRQGDDRVVPSPFTHPAAEAALRAHDEHAEARARARARWTLLRWVVLGESAWREAREAALADLARDIAQAVAAAAAGSAGVRSDLSESDSKAGLLDAGFNVHAADIARLVRHPLLLDRMRDVLGDAGRDLTPAQARARLVQALHISLVQGKLPSVREATTLGEPRVTPARPKRDARGRRQATAQQRPTHPDAIPTPQVLMQRSVDGHGRAYPPHPSMMVQAHRLQRLGFPDSDAFDGAWSRAMQRSTHGGAGSAITFHSAMSSLEALQGCDVGDLTAHLPRLRRRVGLPPFARVTTMHRAAAEAGIGVAPALEGGPRRQHDAEVLARRTIALLLGRAGQDISYELRAGGGSLPTNDTVQGGVRLTREPYTLRAAVSAAAAAAPLGAEKVAPSGVRNEGAGLAALRDVEAALWWAAQQSRAPQGP